MMSEMQIIVDSGGSKSDWMFRNKGIWQPIVSVDGFNPWQHNEKVLESILQNLLRKYPDAIDAAKLTFYGAGCGSDKNKTLIHKILLKSFSKAEIVIYSDLMAAAHAHFGQKSGIACILGTGSNSGYYDGNKIVSSPPSLGYLLGDEGSGASIGKTLVISYFRKEMPKDLRDKFANAYPIKLQDFLNAVYHQKLTASYLAQFAYFAVDNYQHEWIHKLLYDSFKAFVRFNIKSLAEYQRYPIGFIGSVAYQFEAILQQVFVEEGLTISAVLKTPAGALMEYYDELF
ncbi:MAG: hypothetical protein AB7D35_09295 [Bacteroidales bacterium]